MGPKRRGQETNDPAVRVSGLRFSYPETDRPVLDGISFKVERGEFVILTGQSGCGKSTLALCLAGFIPNSLPGDFDGTVVVDGYDVPSLLPGTLAGVVGLVQQDPEAQLCTLTVLDEVAFGPENLCLPPEEIRERVEWALDVVGARDLVGREVHSLSGGEKQRVAIASVLAMKPSIIILDEPTAYLDPGGTQEVFRAISRLRAEHDTTVIVIEHRLGGVLPLASRLIRMEQGRIVSDGPVPETAAVLGEKARIPLFGIPQERDDAPGDALLRAEKLELGYGNTTVLREVGFSLRPGETVALMGNNGSGKTTLLLALLGIVPLRSGRILWSEQDLAGEPVPRRAARMGLVFQNPNHQLFERTVLGEATLPSVHLTDRTPERIGEDARRELARFSLSRYEESLPFALSMGEKKRLTLVSVLTYSPGILLLDEPLVGQDPGRRDLLIHALDAHRLRDGLTLMICHDVDFVRQNCTRVLFLDRGELRIDAPVDIALAALQKSGFTEYM